MKLKWYACVCKIVFIVDRLKRMFGLVLFLHTHILSIFQLPTWILINANACNAEFLFGASSSPYSLKCFNSLFFYFFLFFFATDCFRSPQFISLKLLFSLFVTSNESRPVFSCYVKHLLPSFIMNETDILGSDVCCFFSRYQFDCVPLRRGTSFLLFFNSMTWKQFWTNYIAVQIQFSFA